MKYGRVSTTADENRPLVHLVEFDMAIQAQRGTEAGGGVKLSIASIGIGGDTKTRDSQGTQLRLKFSIPIFCPTLRQGVASDLSA